VPSAIASAEPSAAANDKAEPKPSVKKPVKHAVHATTPTTPPDPFGRARK
jgi:hypothetical protein